MMATTYWDELSRESVCFLESEQEREMAWLEAHPAAIYTGTGKIPEALERNFKEAEGDILQIPAGHNAALELDLKKRA